MAEHTKGPWKISEKRANGTKAYVDGSAGYVVAQAYCSPSANIKYNDLWEEAEANARLIAAAPELIEALQEARTQIAILQSMRGIVDTGHGTLSIIDAALEKAGVKVETGEEVA